MADSLDKLEKRMRNIRTGWQGQPETHRAETYQGGPIAEEAKTRRANIMKSRLEKGEVNRIDNWLRRPRRHPGFSSEED